MTAAEGRRVRHPGRFGRWAEVERAAGEARPGLPAFGPAGVLARVERHDDLFAALR